MLKDGDEAELAAIIERETKADPAKLANIAGALVWFACDRRDLLNELVYPGAPLLR